MDLSDSRVTGLITRLLCFLRCWWEEGGSGKRERDRVPVCILRDCQGQPTETGTDLRASGVSSPFEFYVFSLKFKNPQQALVWEGGEIDICHPALRNMVILGHFNHVRA